MNYENDLADLPRPEPPPDLAAVVLARIARIDEAAPSCAPAPGVWPAWVTALGALAAAVALIVSGPVGGGVLSGIRITRDPVIWGFVLATSLVVYLVGLFGMVSDRAQSIGNR